MDNDILSMSQRDIDRYEVVKRLIRGNLNGTEAAGQTVTAEKIVAIYTSRDEIGVMNLVGASGWYVRGPFMVAGVLYGVVSSVVGLVLLYPILLYYPVLIGLDPTTELLFGNFNSFAYYTANFLLFFVAVTGTSIALGALSSYLAVRRYLRI